MASEALKLDCTVLRRHLGVEGSPGGALRSWWRRRVGRCGGRLGGGEPLGGGRDKAVNQAEMDGRSPGRKSMKGVRGVRWGAPGGGGSGGRRAGAADGAETSWLTSWRLMAAELQQRDGPSPGARSVRGWSGWMGTGRVGSGAAEESNGSRLPRATPVEGKKEGGQLEVERWKQAVEGKWAAGASEVNGWEQVVEGKWSAGRRRGEREREGGCMEERLKELEEVQAEGAIMEVLDVRRHEGAEVMKGKVDREKG
ncbi:hypothetical protein CYMTET_15265 [Cymbomonas tetramitiformis]|uniref:Uncharacterized protein n=1 Tax=Cymbomonas tetramitiformis TaxID=36881 RepID=A0AAE0L9I6_9CHLO|nr:hypothetical protein CYMTET_15265 [Cymbomonas tetramitiformis]